MVLDTRLTKEEITLYPNMYFDTLISALLKQGISVSRLQQWITFTEEQLNKPSLVANN